MRASNIKAEMNFVPFIDVMLVLLIIFMVTSQTIKTESTIDVNLPEKIGEPSASTTIKSDNIVISMSEGNIYLSATYFSIIDKQYTTNEDLAIAVKALMADRPNSKVFVRASKVLPYGEVTGVVDLLSIYGVSGVSLVLDGGKL